MICLLLIMTMSFISSTASTEQKTKHSDTLLKEEDMNAKAKAWLLMVESGRVDQEELRRITPKSIFIAPLLTSRTTKCKEGYRHDHLGQCVKVIKIDPKVQLELLLEQLNKLYGEKKEEKEEETAEIFEESSGPLHFSLPITNAYEKVEKETNDSKIEVNGNQGMINETNLEVPNPPEFLPISLPLTFSNQTNQTKEIESSGAGPLNETESFPNESYPFEGQVASGDEPEEEESTTASAVTLLHEDTDYLEVTEPETASSTEIQSTTEPPFEELTSTTVEEAVSQKSYQNNNLTLSIRNNTEVFQTENTTLSRESPRKNNSNSDKIIFPSDDDTFDDFKTPDSSSAQSSRIRFPDELRQSQPSSYHLLPHSNPIPSKYETNSNPISQEQFWWLPKNWKIDESQHKSALVKVWSRLPLIHDITYSSQTPEEFKKSMEKTYPETFKSEQEDEGFFINPNHNQQPSRIVKQFRRSRFQDVLLTPRQNLRFQR